jgi:hypothetical protein
MPDYVIERELPGAGKLTADQLQNVAKKSNAVLRELGPAIQWHHTYVVDDKLYCVYTAPNPDLIREHARRGGFPADRITEIGARIGPHSAKTPPAMRGAGLTIR